MSHQSVRNSSQGGHAERLVILSWTVVLLGLASTAAVLMSLGWSTNSYGAVFVDWRGLGVAAGVMTASLIVGAMIRDFARIVEEIDQIMGN